MEHACRFQLVEERVDVGDLDPAARRPGQE
jgi:hypothetical protein